MSNKNNSGIDSFLNTQKLFKSTSYKMNQRNNKTQSFNSSGTGKGSASKGYHYHLLNANLGSNPAEQTDNTTVHVATDRSRQTQNLEIRQQNLTNPQSFKKSVNDSKKEDKTENYKQSQPNSQIQRNSLRQNVSSSIKKQSPQPQQQKNNLIAQQSIPINVSNTNKYNINRSLFNDSQYENNRSDSYRFQTSQPIHNNISNHPINQVSSSLQKRRALSKQHEPAVSIQQQMTPTAWQSLVIKSSRRYFDSCRSQALQYITKLQAILHKDYNFLAQSLDNMHSQIIGYHNELFSNIKQYLYMIVDQSVQNWKNKSIKNSLTKQNQLKHLAQLYELNTQIEQRNKTIEKIKYELENQKEWKNRASDLLTANYQADLLELSRMVNRAVGEAERNLALYWERVGRDIRGRYGSRQYTNEVSQKVQQIISRGYPNYQQQAQTNKNIKQNKNDNSSNSKNLQQKEQNLQKIKDKQQQKQMTSTSVKLQNANNTNTSNLKQPSFFNTKSYQKNENKQKYDDTNQTNKKQVEKIQKIYTFNQQEANTNINQSSNKNNMHSSSMNNNPGSINSSINKNRNTSNSKI